MIPFSVKFNKYTKLCVIPSRKFFSTLISTFSEAFQYDSFLHTIKNGSKNAIRAGNAT